MGGLILFLVIRLQVRSEVQKKPLKNVLQTKEMAFYNVTLAILTYINS